MEKKKNEMHRTNLLLCYPQKQKHQYDDSKICEENYKKRKKEEGIVGGVKTWQYNIKKQGHKYRY